MSDEDIKNVFEEFDADKNGAISKEELTKAFQQLSEENGTQIDMAEIDAWWPDFKKDANGDINLEEFTKIFKDI